MKLKEVKRKHFRFPLYADVASLKLKTKRSTRVIFEGDDFITNHVNDRPIIQKEKAAVVSSYDNDHVYKSKVSSNAKVPKITVDSSNNEAMKINCPSSKRFAKLQDVSGKSVGVPIKKQPFYRAQDSTFLKNRNLSKDITAKKTNSQRDYVSELQRENSKTIKQQYSGDVDRFRSRMKKIPSSLSKKQEKSTFTKDELLSSMHKNSESFILFDDEKTSANLQNKQNLQQASATKAVINRNLKNKNHTKTKDKQARVLDRGLAGIFAEESKGIDKVRNKFFTD
jgi:hypothetical protein